MEKNEVEFGGLFLQKRGGFLHSISFDPGTITNVGLKIEGSFLTRDEDKGLWYFVGGDSVGLTRRPQLTDNSGSNAKALNSLGVPILSWEGAKENLAEANKQLFVLNKQ